MFTWLVVEDEPDLYDTLLALFQIYGVHGITFTNGTDAMRWIENLNRDGTKDAVPQLALLDIGVPDISGSDIGHCLRQSSILNNIAVVLMTAHHLTPSEEEQVIMRAQADALIYKPLSDPDDFVALLEDALTARHAS